MQSFAESDSPKAGQKANLLGRSVGLVLDANTKAGVVVVPGAAHGTCKVPATAGDAAKAIGVTVYDPLTPAYSSTYDYESARVCEVLKEGEIWCVCEEAMAEGSKPYVRHTANGAGKLYPGVLRSDADTANAELLPNAQVVYPSTGAGVVKIAINLPQAPAS
jgi:hypothetical protein